ncbi:ABC transporter ATP-binding protein [Actinopolymorpha sp. B9G3]|uniref:ABC transporter ATP-binding protein n=1 Tax=Actinopolymorpha sp. B9G3 TaxID=3158970 RepID=UPI0032D94388
MSHETTASFATAFRLLVGFVARTSPPRFAGLLALATVEGLLGPLVMAATGLAVARAPAAFDAGVGSAQAYDLALAILLVGLAFGAGQLLAPIRVAVSTGLGSMVAQRIRQCLLDATLSPPGIAHLEDAETANEIQRAGEYEWADLAPLTRIVTEFGSMVSKVVTAAGAAVLLAGFAWWAPVLLVAGALASHVWMAGNEHAAIEKHEEYAPLVRRANYFANLSHDPPAAKEVRLFGLVGLLASQTRHYRTEFGRHVWRARRAKLRPVLATITSIAVATGIVLGALASAAVEGRIDAAGLTVAVQAIYAIELLGSGLFATWWVRQGAAALPHLRALPARTSALSFAAYGTGSADGMPRRHIRFADVRFGYPGHDRPVLDGLSLEIRAGESLAIVGENGEGKTTLLKLLTRLYDPDEGAILVDGHDLRDLDLASWRSQVAVIFQDFVRYELSARANIGFGRVTDLDNAEAAARAADRVGAHDLITGLPAGWDTVLARQYRGGLDLSGGQWQRIALARALRAAEGGARLLVLDEPTAALDVRAEAELFDFALRGFQGVGPLGEQSLDLTAGVTTLLITHRLSSVRRADRIAVVGGGRVVEVGTHDELLAAGGVYARMFRLQAQRFETGASHG